MKAIWKYNIDISDVCHVAMQQGAEILSVQQQGGWIVMWAIVDTEKPIEKRTFLLYGTGHTIPEIPDAGRKYIGTVQLRGGALVLHIFEKLT
jgi:hypothetical protein